MAEKADPKAHLEELKSTIENLKDYSVIHIQQERFGEEMGPKIKLKVKSSKGRLYIHILEGPKTNAEVIYRPSWNDGKARVHKGSFPDFTVNVSPRGSLMMDKQHHSIEQLSFQSMFRTLLESAVRCEPMKGAGIQEVSSDRNDDGPNLTLELRAPWVEKSGTVSTDEDVWAFSKRMETDPYLILHNNGLKDFDDVSEGMQLKSPVCYATRTLLTLNRKSHLPVRLVTYDGKGNLYESYEWQELDVTTPLREIDFDPENKDYDF